MWQKQASDFISSVEGCELHAYPDPIYKWKLPTIGFGTTKYPQGNPVKQGDVITLEQAKLYLEFWIKEKIEPELKKIKTWEQMNDNQKVALTSFAYNLGARFYKGKNFTSITKVCDSPTLWKDRPWVIKQFEKYCSPKNPNVTRGLRLRRQKEADLFCS